MPWYSAKYTIEYDRAQSALGQQGDASGLSAPGIAVAKAGAAGFEASGAAPFDPLRAGLATPRPGDSNKRGRRFSIDLARHAVRGIPAEPAR